MDTVAFKKKNRAKLWQLVDRYKAKVIVLYVATPLATVRQRLIKNRKTKERSDVRVENFNEVVNNFEIPDSTEKPIVITSATTIEEVIIKTNSL